MKLRKLSVVLAAVVVGLLTQASLANAYLAGTETASTIADFGPTVPIPSIEMRAPGTISSISVELNNLSHTFARDLDIAVEAPDGQLVMLMSDACGPATISGLYLGFSPTNVTAIPEDAPCTNGNYATADYGTTNDPLTSKPGANYSLSLSSLIGIDPNGVWKLHIEDDTDLDGGSLGSWAIRIDTDVAPSLGLTRLPETGEGGPSTPAVVMSKDVSDSGSITDVDVVLRDLTHVVGTDLDVLLVSPGGTGVVLMSDQCGGTSLLRADFRFDDAAPIMLPDSNSIAACQVSSATLKPFDAGDVETAIPGAPAGPYSTSLSAFNGQSASGTWRLYLHDDLDSSSASFGYIKDFDLAITQAPAPAAQTVKQLKLGRAAIKYKKSGKSKILASGRIPLIGDVVTAGECSGTAKATFQVKTTRKKGNKRVTSFSRVSAVKASLTSVNGGCGVNVSAKLAKKYSGKQLRLVVDFAGNAAIAPVKGNASVKVKRLKFS